MSTIFGEIFSFPQENGPEVELRVYGDEFYSRRETPAGYTVIYDESLGQYCYAILREGEFASSRIAISDPPSIGLQPHLEEAAPIKHEKFSRRYSQLRPSESDTDSN
jgi:hypothetical protein